jgi:hypothetical protein
MSRHLETSYRPFGLIALLLASYALRVRGLGDTSLWFDEAVEYWSAQAPLDQIWRGLLTMAESGATMQPPLFTYVLNKWLAVDHGEFWMRYLSVCASVVTVAACVAATRRVVGAAGGSLGPLAAGALVAFSPAAIRYARDVSEYSLTAMWLAVALFACAVALDGCGRPFAPVAGAFAFALHYGAIIPLVAMALAARNASSRPAPDRGSSPLRLSAAWRTALVVGGPIAIALTSVGPSLAAQLPDSRGDLPVSATQFAVALVTPPLGALRFTFEGWPWSPIGDAVGAGVALAALMLIGGTAGVARRRRHQGERAGSAPRRSGRKGVDFVSTAAVGAICLYAFLVAFGLYAYGRPGERYALVLLPLIAVSVGAAVAVASPSRTARAGFRMVLVVVLVTCLASFPGARSSRADSNGPLWPEREMIEPIVTHCADWIAEHRGGTYVHYSAAPAHRYYAERLGIARAGDLGPGWYLDCWRAIPTRTCGAGDGPRYGAWLRGASASAVRADIERLMGGVPESLCVVTAHAMPAELAPLRDALGTMYETVQARELPGAAAFTAVTPITLAMKPSLE